MQVHFGKSVLEYPSDRFGHLTDSSPLVGDRDALRERFDRDGYLYLPGFIDPQKVTDARERILDYMAEREALVPGQPVLDGVMPKGGKTVSMMGRNPITTDPAVLRALEAEELFEFFADFYGEPPLTFDYKWLRAVGNESFTGSHFDVVYMGRGSLNVNTVWIPLGDIPIAHGTLAICEGSHRAPGFEKLRATYGQMDVDRDNVEGWFSENAEEILERFGGRWLTADFKPGDILTFGLYTLHASTTNTTNRYRLSCDVRFQPSSEPIDERWVGTTPKGHYAWMKTPGITMEAARERWGV
ncbi:MAG: phytanoyl-CoA dioxygenase [Spirochaetaceae bacterium]|nr:MAG: phytanoyl-CoA dioxygenase [Spirochaetaceae bacterium]